MIRKRHLALGNKGLAVNSIQMLLLQLAPNAGLLDFLKRFIRSFLRSLRSFLWSLRSFFTNVSSLFHPLSRASGCGNNMETG